MFVTEIPDYCSKITMFSEIIVFLVLLMNAVLGTIQYRKAEKSLDSLKGFGGTNGPGYP